MGQGSLPALEVIIIIIHVIIAFGPCCKTSPGFPILGQPLKLSPGVTHVFGFCLEIAASGVSWAASLCLSLWIPGQGLTRCTSHRLSFDVMALLVFSGSWLLGSLLSAFVQQFALQSLVPAWVSSGQNCCRTVSRCGQVCGIRSGTCSSLEQSQRAESARPNHLTRYFPPDYFLAPSLLLARCDLFILTPIKSLKLKYLTLLQLNAPLA